MRSHIERASGSVIPKQNSVFVFAVPLYSIMTLQVPGAGQPKSQPALLPAPQGEPEAAVDTVLDRPHIEFELYGNQFRYRSAERAGRKFKHKETIEL